MISDTQLQLAQLQLEKILAMEGYSGLINWDKIDFNQLSDEFILDKCPMNPKIMQKIMNCKPEMIVQYDNIYQLAMLYIKNDKVIPNARFLRKMISFYCNNEIEDVKLVKMKLTSDEIISSNIYIEVPSVLLHNENINLNDMTIEQLTKVAYINVSSKLNKPLIETLIVKLYNLQDKSQNVVDIVREAIEHILLQSDEELIQSLNESTLVKVAALVSNENLLQTLKSLDRRDLLLEQILFMKELIITGGEKVENF